MKSDIKNSDITHGYVSYVFNLKEGEVEFKGSAVSSGNTLAISFNNVKNKTDHGVGLANVSYDFDNEGNIIATKFTKFYYEPEYVSHGIETCVKQ